MAKDRSLPKDIAELDLSAVEKELGAKVTAPIAAKCILGLRRYYALCREHPNESLYPTNEIDWAWHPHILKTKKYAEDCQKIFGHFLDHESGEGTATLKMRKRAQQLHLKRFGEPMFGTDPAGCSADCRD